MKEHRGLIAVCLIFLAAGALRLNELSLYTPDSSRYLIWGNSLAHGKGFVDNTLPEPDPYVVHAPLYPVLIAPIEFFAPYSVAAVKAWTLLWGVAAVILCYMWIERVRGKKWALAGAIILAANPLFWLYSTEVLSDSPFIAAILAAFYLAEDQAPDWKRFSLLLLAVVFAAMVREVGAGLLIAATLSLLWTRNFKRAALLLAAAGSLMAIWYVRNNVYVSTSSEYAGGNVSLLFRKLITGGDVSLMNEFALRLWLALRSYASQLSSLVFYPMYSGHFGHLFFTPSSVSAALERLFSGTGTVLALATGVLVIIGFFLDLRSRFRTLYFLVYCGAVLLYPINDIRFLVPLVPLLALYLLRGSDWLMTRFSPDARRFALAIVLLSMLPNLMSEFEMIRANREEAQEEVRTSDESALYTSLYDRPWPSMGAWIRQNVEEEAVIISPYKQLSTVVGNRKVLILDKGITLSEFERSLRDNDAHYIVAPRRWGRIKVYEALMMGSRRFRFEPVFAARDLFLLRIHPALREPSAAPDPAPPDTLGDASGELHRGWKEFSVGNYATAHQHFLGSLSIAPSQPEIIYYALVTSSILGDSSRATELRQRLYETAQAGSYLDPANTFLKAMNQLSDAKRLKYEEGVAVQSYKAASIYWSLGTWWKAAQIMNSSLSADTNYFVGLLWSFHYNLQLGDTSRARACLLLLDLMDRTNPIVVSFHGILAIGDSLKNPGTPSDRSRLHLSAAGIYRKIELKSEAFDEAELALRENPRNIDALMFIARDYEERHRPVQAASVQKQIRLLAPTALPPSSDRRRVHGKAG